MRKKRKTLLISALTLIFILTLSALALADDYSSHWSAHYINDAASRGWMTGDGSGNFRPEAAITRGEFAMMLWRAQGQPQPMSAGPFTDVPRSAFYYQAVTALFEARVVNGFDSTTFGPNITLTREMGCTMLARAYNLSPVSPSAFQTFADYAEVSEWARSAVSALVEKNYITGVGDNKIAPKQQLKRGEMAKLLTTVFDGMQNSQAAAAVAQQNAVAALTSFISGPSITIEQTALGSDEVSIAVTATDSWGVTYVGWRASEKDATYKNNSGFRDISSALEFTLNENGWYAVYAENKNGYSSFKLFEVSTIRENSPKVSLSQRTIAASGLVEITISVTKASNYAEAEIDYVGYRTAKERDSFSSKTGFDDKNITDNKFTVDPIKDYGWYAVCAVDKNGRFGYRLIEVKKPGANYTVTFDADGGAPVPAKQSVAYNGKVIKPSDPTKSGYTFDGWYNENTEWDFDDDTIMKDITLKANWVDSDTKYTVTFNSQGGSAVSPITNISHGEKITAPTDPTKGSDVFDGWYKENTYANSWNFTSDTVKSNITLHAKWTTPPTATPPNITTSDLPNGKVDTPYSKTLAADGDAPITWEIDNGALPSGLSLSGDAISGAPTESGEFTITVTATNDAGSDTKEFTITIDP